MTRTNGIEPSVITEIPTAPPPAAGPAAEENPALRATDDQLATRTKQRRKQQLQQNRFVIVGAGAVVLALMIFVFISIPWREPGTKRQTGSNAGKDSSTTTDTVPAEKTIFPIMDSGRQTAKTGHDGYLNEQDLEKTAKRQTSNDLTNRTQSNVPGTLGSIPPFGDQQPWQAPPYQPGMNTSVQSETADMSKSEREMTDKPSLVYVRKLTTAPANPSSSAFSAGSDTEMGLGLKVGTRLRARLESAASTAVRTPVLAVIEYNYERNGEIIVPAGSKAVGIIQDADRSGYVRIQFDSIIMPDGATVPIQAAATDLDLRPLRGKVEGKNTGKNVLVRSLSGIGQAGAILVGRGSLNQPLSESDLLRERVSNNIGVASDEEISRTSITQRIVVTIAADTTIYVVLEQTPKTTSNTTLPEREEKQTHSIQTGTDGLRQLLQLQRELKESSSQAEN